MGGIITTLTSGNKELPLRGTADGELQIFSVMERDIAETNRLLRKLIAGLELYLGSEFPEVE